MRADRLLSILLLLQMHRRLTAKDLANRLEVSERTIHRDMEALGMAGVPVVAERGTHGGWMLMEGYRTNLTGLNEAEIQALFMAVPPRLLADLKLNKAQDAALLKLLAELPSVSRRGAEYARQRIHVDVTNWNRTEELFPHLQTVQEAVWQERKLLFSYGRTEECDPVERLVDPLGLVAKGSVWYLVARVEGETRSYRVSRIETARIMDEPCVRPVDFDLQAYWERSSAEFRSKFPRYDGVVRVHPSAFPRMAYAGRFARIVHAEEPEADGWRRVRMRFQFEWDACEYVLSFGPLMEALEPETMRHGVIRLAENTLAFYKSKDEGGRMKDEGVTTQVE